MLTIVCRTKVSISLQLVSMVRSKHATLIKFGHMVRDQRKKLGLSQEKLAELADVHRTYVGMIERGEKNITLLNIEKIAKALKIPSKNLLQSKG